MDKLNQKIFLPAELITSIVELVEKYKLGPTTLFDNEEMQKILGKAKTPEKNLELLENQPFEKIKKIVRGIIIGKFSVEELPSLLAQRLELSKEKSEKIADELTDILLLTKTISKKGEVPKEERALKKEEVSEEKPSKEEEIPKKEGPELEKPSVSLKEKKKEKETTEDVYREPIE